MENKLTWVELKKVVARQTDLTEKEVNILLTAWLEEMSAALKRGEELHINGLGTFKVKKMKPRKSVDVTTGQAIVLPETDRLTFTMASGLEEQLRDDAPKKRQQDGIDPIKKLGEQADEILDIIGEIKAIGQEGEEPKRREGEEAKRRGGEEAKRREGEKKDRWWLTAGITVVVFLGMLIGLFFFFQHKMEEWLLNLREKAEMVEEREERETLEALDTLETLETLETLDTLDVPEDNHYREYGEFIAEEEMHKDSRLAWMAYRYYGNKKLWVFIYDANKDHLSNPEKIAVGTLIRVPKLSKEILDFGEDVQVQVEEMHREFIGDR